MFSIIIPGILRQLAGPRCEARFVWRNYEYIFARAELIERGEQKVFQLARGELAIRSALSAIETHCLRPGVPCSDYIHDKDNHVRMLFVTEILFRVSRLNSRSGASGL